MTTNPSTSAGKRRRRRSGATSATARATPPVLWCTWISCATYPTPTASAIVASARKGCRRSQFQTMGSARTVAPAAFRSRVAGGVPPRADTERDRRPDDEHRRHGSGGHPDHGSLANSLAERGGREPLERDARDELANDAGVEVARARHRADDRRGDGTERGDEHRRMPEVLDAAGRAVFRRIREMEELHDREHHDHAPDRQDTRDDGQPTPLPQLEQVSRYESRRRKCCERRHAAFS